MKSEFSYSKEWQPYLGYDKFEYDVRDSNGLVYLNCYPNAGIFESFDSGETINEENVAEIRYSVEPILFLNHSLYPDDIPKTKSYQDEVVFKFKNFDQYTPKVFGIKELKNKVEVRTIPKVGRNEPCPCGCGKKFKKCNVN